MASSHGLPLVLVLMYTELEFCRNAAILVAFADG